MGVRRCLARARADGRSSLHRATSDKIEQICDKQTSRFVTSDEYAGYAGRSIVQR